MTNVAHDSHTRLGELVRDFRGRSGLTQQELADLSGLSVASLRDVEQGRVTRPRPATLHRLSEALGLSPTEAQLLLPKNTEPLSHETRIAVLGPLRLTVGGTPITLTSRIQRTLLGLLALSPNAPVSRDALTEAVWGSDPPAGVTELLQSHISRIRQRLRHGTQALEIVGTTAGYELTVSTDQHDMLAFQELLAKARAYQQEGETSRAQELFVEAMKLWHGDPLTDLPALAIHPVVVAWTAQWRAAVVDYANLAAELGRYEEVIPQLQHIVRDDPLHEGAHAALMIALAGSGQQAAALTTFHALRRRLADQLGADPGPELTHAYQRVLRQEVTRPESGPVTAHRQLPPDIADFSGRTTEIRTLLNNMPRADQDRTAAVIFSVEGMGGVGKTRLAVHLAHRLRATGQYSDQQLYVDLLGHATLPPADPSAVLASFLRLLGVPGSQIPEDIEERAALYRDRLYDQKALVLLDNAANENQVLPLLPAGPTNLVLVTSRRTLALDGAYTLPLDVFTFREANELLVQVVGSTRVMAEPVAATRVVELCGRLPLGVALAARRLRSRTAWRFADLADRLEEADNRLGELTAGGRRLQTVFELSYQALDNAEKEVFCLLGLHLGEDFTAASTAALIQQTPEATRQLLDHLVDERLVIAVSGERYRFHDLLRTYAQQLANREMPEPRRRAATGRLLDYYLYTASRAADLLQPHRWLADLTGTPPTSLTQFRTRQEANQWLADERANLLTAVPYAAEHGWPTHAWQLAHAMWVSLYLDGHTRDITRAQQIALAAAVSIGDQVGEAVTRTYLGSALVDAGSEDAFDQLRRALLLHRQAGNHVLETNTLCSLGNLARRTGRFSESLEHLGEAALLVSGRDDYREGVLRTNMASSLSILARYSEALESSQRGLVLARSGRDLHGESCSLAEIGDAYRGMGRFEEAIDYLTQALEIEGCHGPQEAYCRKRLGMTYRDLKRYEEAKDQLELASSIARLGNTLVSEGEVLVELGVVHRLTGDFGKAQHVLERALARAVETNEFYQQARAYHELSLLNQATGRTHLARQHLQDANVIFQKLDLPQQGEKELSAY